ncbi:MAG TPA: riboflavin synthase [bacterium]|nr:riboflavin synthase [bacterium]
MFTGIIEELGQIKKITRFSGGKRFQILASRVLEDTKIGDSIAVNGVCLSVTQLYDQSFEAQAVQETLKRSNLSYIQKGGEVNLERPLKASDRLDGHFVQGHVDGEGQFLSRKNLGDSAILKFVVPDNLLNYIVKKGSIALNGVSLTVTEIQNNKVHISIIPITLQDTNLGKLKSGDKVNIEVDVLAKYVEKQLGNSQPGQDFKGKIKKWGYD